jgi:hypothetical protein
VAEKLMSVQTVNAKYGIDISSHSFLEGINLDIEKVLTLPALA